MKIWIITIGEPIIHKANALRIHRSGLLAKHIAEHTSHDVVWWTSLFNHFTKQFEFDDERDITPISNLKIKCLKRYGYKKNISLARYYDHYIIQKKFRNRLANEPDPDIIISAYPTLGLCEEAVRYANKKSIPILIDYRDLWPEVFYDLFPRIINFIPKIIFYPFSIRFIRVLQKSTGIIGITKEILEKGIKKAKRNPSNYDAFFYLGYDRLTLTETELNENYKFWESFDIKQNDGFVKICFFGTLGHQMDFDTLINSFNGLSQEKIKLIICGSGDKEEYLKNLSTNKNIVFPGYMSAIQLKSLMHLSDFGICPHLPKQMYLDTMPGKAIEYMSEGLPILTSLKKGVLGNFIIKNDFGLNYEPFNEESLVTQLKFIIKQIQFYKSKKNQIVDYYNNNFDKTIVYKKYLKHIENTFNNYNLKKK